VKYWCVAYAGLLMAAASPCFAANSFYIEIGQDAASDVAGKQWHDLQASHKAMLGSLHYFPKAVVQSGSELTRIQAGPIDSKEKAQKICTRLFHENVSCFVMEGLGDAPPTKILNMSEESMSHPVKSVQLPWLPGTDIAPPAPIAEVPAPAAVPSEPEAKPQLVQDAEETTAPAPAAAKKPQIHVAEAIRVPLTQSTDQQQNAKVVVDELPVIKPAFAPSHEGDSKYADESLDSGPGWLVVESFPDEEIASSFWEEVRHSSAKQVKKLRMRIVRPLMASGHAGASLNVGAFASSSDAYDFCRKNIQASARGLTCRFSTEDPGKDEQEAPRHRLAQNPPAVDSAAVAAPRQKYWIQVAAASSQDEALSQWENVKSENDDVVHGMRNSISVSSDDKKTYVVRLGPMDDHDEAIHACAQLQDRGVDCQVVLYSPKKR